MMDNAMKVGFSTEHKQDNEVGSVMTEEITSSAMAVSENNRQRKWATVPLMNWPSTRSMENNRGELDRMESGMTVVCGSGGESDGCKNLRRYLMSMDQFGKLPSSQYKGVVTQPNRQWGAQIYEKNQRMWLETFNGEQDAARAYDQVALNFWGREAMTNFSPARGGDQEAQFMREHNKEESAEMLRKHTYGKEFEKHRKRIVMTAARSVSMNNAEPSVWEGSCQRAHVCQENEAAVDGRGNASMGILLREHLFDKAVTPSDVGKLNRLVIPKLHAMRCFPLDVDSSVKGLLLNFEDITGKVWRFRYSYWNSSQSYVLTKGWSRFVKEKKLKSGDIVSFHRGLAQPRKIYISWRHRPSG